MNKSFVILWFVVNFYSLRDIYIVRRDTVPFRASEIEISKQFHLNRLSARQGKHFLCGWGGRQVKRKHAQKKGTKKKKRNGAEFIREFKIRIDICLEVPSCSLFFFLTDKEMFSRVKTLVEGKRRRPCPPSGPNSVGIFKARACDKQPEKKKKERRTRRHLAPHTPPRT